MRYSDKLNGYWEKERRYYFEFRDGRGILREYRRKVMIDTEISYDAERLESGARTEISLADTTWARDAFGGAMTRVKTLAYENGRLFFATGYVSEEDDRNEYVLEKVDHGPFDHIRIRDDEFLPRLAGVWKAWGRSKEFGNELFIDEKERKIICLGRGLGAFHVVSYAYAPERVYIVPEDLTEDSFGSYTRFEVKPDMLTTTEMVFDMSMPLTVFAREEMLDKIEIPEAAKQAPRSVMMCPPPGPPMGGMMGGGMMGPLGMQMMRKLSKSYNFCTNCGAKLESPLNFCPECGAKIGTL